MPDILEILNGERIESTDKDFVDQIDELAQATARTVKEILRRRAGHLPMTAQNYFLKRFSESLGNPLIAKDALTLKMIDAIRVLVEGFQQKPNA